MRCSYNIHYVNIALAVCGGLAVYGGAGRKENGLFGAGLWPFMTTIQCPRAKVIRQGKKKKDVKKSFRYCIRIVKVYLDGDLKWNFTSSV